MIEVALAFFVILLFLWEVGFESVVARVGRGVIRLITFGRFRLDDTGDPANIVVGALTIIALFFLILLL